MSTGVWTRRASMLVALGLAPGCYTGLDPSQGGDDGIPPRADGGDDGADDGADDGDDGVQGACGDPQSGEVALRRLTNEQYRRTVRDLLGVQTDAVDAFAPDEQIGAFKSNGVAPVGDLQVEQYMDAAEAIAAEASSDIAGLLPCDPAAVGEDMCADEFIRTMGLRAYRRPLQEDEVAALTAVYQAGKAEDDFANGIRVTLQGMLQSPFFLYHVEFGAATNGSDGSDGAVVELTAYELASRMSYFLWGSMPDDTLFAAAESGALDDEDGLDAEIDRMLADDKAREAVADFHLQWTGVDELEYLEKDPGTYPAFNSGLAAAMKQETADFANWVINDGDGKLDTLLTAAVAMTDDPELLALYGAQPSAVAGEPAALDPSQRAGLLTQASLLAEHAHANQSSPVHRGKLVRENFLCQPLPPPPNNVNNTPPDPDPGATTRERFAEHTGNPECSGCHTLIDGIGFGFEAYDGIGAFRTLDQGLEVDASGNIIGTDIDGDFDGGVELANLIADSDQVRACVATQWFRYALGRTETADDQCAIDTMTAAFAESDYDIRELIKTTVRSDSFRFRRTAEEN